MRPVDVGWIRFFVVVGRLGSLSAAAKELNMTQPAVSYQIRRAEAQFGAPLFERQHRGVALTEAGQELYDALSLAVDRVDRLAAQINREDGPDGVRLYTDYALSALWLVPRISQFRETHPEIDIQIIASQNTDPRQLQPGDTAVLFGPKSSFGPEAQLLIAEQVVPVCAPSLLDIYGEDALRRAPLIHLDSPQPSPWLGWRDYLADKALHRDPQADPGNMRFNTYSLVIGAALAGQGIALGWRGIVDAHLESGLLVALGADMQVTDRGYFLLQHPPQDDAGARLQSWLLTETGQG